MKRRRVIIGYFIPALIVLATATLAVWQHHHPRQLPVSQCSELYQHYYRTEGIEAAFIKDFDLGDSVTVDVTVLKATDNAVWDRLVEEFCLDNIDSSIVEDVRKNKNNTTVKLFPKGHPCDNPDTLMSANNLLICSFALHEMSIFDLKGNESLRSIITYKFHNYKEKGLTQTK